MVRYSAIRGIGSVLLVLGMLSCAAHDVAPPPVAAGDNEDDWFVDATVASGIDFVHDSGATGEYYFPEMSGSGAALFDYDDDGDLDLYLVQGTKLGPSGTLPGTLADRLFRNDLISAEGRHSDLRFTDVTTASGITARGYGHGVATGDYDGDGHVDLYVTTFGPNQLWHNNGDGTFSDVTASSGTGDPRWSISAAFVDYDDDGDLDIYVTNYVSFSFETHKPCASAQGNRDYCGPNSYQSVPDRLYQNRGDGTFEDVSESARIIVKYGSGLGLVTGDFNLDGRVDIYVANDGMANFLWLNEGRSADGNVTFRDGALLSGTALAGHGQPEASMGVDAGDYDNDGDLDIVLTHLMGESNTLYVNSGGGIFSDGSLLSNIGPPSRSYTAFGTAFVDYDNDSWLDLLSVNGAVISIEGLELAGDARPYHQPNQLLRNQGDGTFSNVSSLAGVVFELSEISRGAAFGDIDNDGDTDVVITNLDGPARLLVNQVGNKSHYLGVELLTRDGNKNPIGVKVMLVRDGEPVVTRYSRATASYCSANDSRILFGLGSNQQNVSIEVEWSDGERERFLELATDRYHTITAGTGERQP